MSQSTTVREAICPFIDQDDHRCASRFSLRRIDQAFCYCLYGHLACPTYYQLSREQQRREAARCAITIRGEAIDDFGKRQPAPKLRPPRACG